MSFTISDLGGFEDFRRKSPSLSIILSGQSQRSLLESLRQYLQNQRGIELRNKLSEKGVKKLELSHGKKTAARFNNGTLSVTLSATTLTNATVQLKDLVERLKVHSGDSKPATSTPATLAPQQPAPENLGLGLLERVTLPEELSLPGLSKSGYSFQTGRAAQVTPVSETENRIDRKLRFVPNVGDDLYNTLWHVPSMILARDERAVEVACGTGGQFEFYDKANIQRIIGLDTGRECTYAVKTKYDIPFVDANMFTPGWASFPIFQNRIIPVALGTNGIYYARDKHDLKTLFTELDHVLKPGQKKTKGIFHVLCGGGPNRELWGTNDHLAMQNLMTEAVSVLTSLGYNATYLDVDLSKDTPLDQLNQSQREVIAKGYIGVHFEGRGYKVLRESNGSDPPIIELTDIGHYYIEGPHQNEFSESLSAVTLVALKPC